MNENHAFLSAVVVASLWVTASVTASCGAEPVAGTGRVRLDLSSTFVNRQGLAQPVDVLRLRASAPEVSIEQVVDLDHPVFDFEVPSGSLLVEIRGEHDFGLGPVATYFGDVRIAVPPNSVQDNVVIHMFQAGEAELRVAVAAGKLPSRALVAFVPSTPRAGQSTVFDAVLVAGDLRRTLPTGDYTYHAVVSFDGGQSFNSLGPSNNSVTVTQGAVTKVLLDLSKI